MKLSILAILFCQVFSYKLRGTKEDGTGIEVLVTNSKFYNSAPVVYTPDSSQITYPLTNYPSNAVPVTYTRKSTDKANYFVELKKLKNEIWGDENYDTTDMRQNNSVYDARWLVAQLKITRVLELEDYLASNARKAANKSEGELKEQKVEVKKEETKEIKDEAKIDVSKKEEKVIVEEKKK